MDTRINWNKLYPWSEWFRCFLIKNTQRLNSLTTYRGEIKCVIICQNNWIEAGQGQTNPWQTKGMRFQNSKRSSLDQYKNVKHFIMPNLTKQNLKEKKTWKNQNRQHAVFILLSFKHKHKTNWIQWNNHKKQSRDMEDSTQSLKPDKSWAQLVTDDCF